MKIQIRFALHILLAVFFLLSCSKSIENKIAGTWKVEDVRFESEQPMDPARIESSKQMAKSVSYELLKDKTAKIHAGTTVLEGNWTYKKEESGVYMAFKGSFDTVLLGRYEDGKLINEASRTNVKIITIFNREE